MGNRNNSYRWWKRHKDAVFSTIISAVIGYLVGFYLDGFTSIKPAIDNIQKQTKELSDSIIKYRNEANVAISYVKYNSHNGTMCKVGINDKIQDHFVSVSAENSHGLKQGEKIYLINVNESDFCIYTKIAFVQIAKNSPHSNADFFINKKMLKRLNISSEHLSQGVFSLYYKQDTK